MDARRMGVWLVLSGLVFLPFGYGKQETGQVRDKQEKVVKGLGAGAENAARGVGDIHDGFASFGIGT